MAFWPHLCPPRPEVAAFLQDIREHPEDDTPRLVLADWLDDFGDAADQARAELIRIQCRLAQPGKAPAALRRRQRELEERHARDWLGPLAQLADHWRFERGMAHVALEGLRCFAPALIELVRTETYAWVEGLLLLELTGGAINPLVQQPILRGLRSLTVAESRIGDLGAGLLAQSPHLAGLSELHLGHCGLTGTGVQALASCGYLESLEVLDLARNAVGRLGLHSLAETDSLPNLRTLCLAHAEVPDSALIRFADSPLLARLERLDLQANRDCGDLGLTVLVESANAAGLRRLGLQQTGARLGAMQGLGRATHLDRLTHLYLDDTRVSNDCLKALALGPGLPGLHTLSLGRNSLTDVGVVALLLAERPWRALELGRNHLGEESAAALARSAALAGLTELGLEDNHLGDAGALALASSPHLNRLRLLDVGNNGLSAAGKAVLLRRFGHQAVVV
jgi:uncharacterized protein (TIGR02996 family)